MVGGPERGGDCVVHRREGRPARRDLEGVDDDLVPGERLQGGHVVAVRHPPVDQRNVEARRAVALLLNHPHHAVEHRVVALVEDQQHVMVVDVEVALRLGVVVQPQDSGSRTAAENLPAGVEAFADPLGPRQRVRECRPRSCRAGFEDGGAFGGRPRFPGALVPATRVARRGPARD